jgi:hypothetical protein
VDLQPLTSDHFDWGGLTEDEWVEGFVRPSFEQQFKSGIHWELGTSWSKALGFTRLPAANSDKARTITDLFGEENQWNWQTEDGKLIVWINFKLEDIRSPRTTTGKRRKSETDDSSTIVKRERTASPAINPSFFNSPQARTQQMADEESIFLEPASPSILEEEDRSIDRSIVRCSPKIAIPHRQIPRLAAAQLFTLDTSKTVDQLIRRSGSYDAAARYLQDLHAGRLGVGFEDSGVRGHLEGLGLQ